MAAVHDRKIAAALLFAATCALADEAPRPPGYRLGDGAAPTAYQVRLEIDPAADAFVGEARVAFTLKSPAPIVWMHATQLSIDRVEVMQGERRIEVEVIASGEDYLGLKAKGEPFAAAQTSALFGYRGRIETLSQRGLFRQQEAGESYVISQHEETSARRTFPCFDEPGWKTPWTLTIDAPGRNVVVSNTPEASAGDVPGRAGWMRHVFATTKPLPTYLVALAVGPFEIVDGGTAGMNRTPLRYLTPKGRAAEARYAREATPRILELLEDYFGMAYPFEKLDSLALPEAYNFGAMENVGLVTYGVSILLATRAQETSPFRRRYVGVAAHEIAHMWFGDFVTLAWWDDIWLNESFASWIGAKTVFRFNPAWDTGESRARNRGLAIATDRLASARRIRNPVNNKEDLEGSFDSITYQKGSAVLEMFEQWIGRAEFRAGVRAYLEAHAHGSATSSDFFRAIAAASGRGAETTKAFEAFVDQSGVPLIDADLVCGKDPAAIALSQQRLRPRGSKAEDRAWTTPACFRYPAPLPGPMGDGRTQCEAIANPPRSIALAGGPACPAWLLGNAGGSGHYVVRYGSFLWKRNVRFAASLSTLEAVAFVNDSALLAQSGLIPVSSAFDLADAAIAHRSPVVQLMAIRLLEHLSDDRLTDAELRRKRAVITLRVQPLARRIGWQEKPKEPEEVAELRATLLPFAARSEGGAALRTQARRLAIAWMRDRSTLADTIVPAVLDTTARFADRATYELLESLTLTTVDGRERRRLHAALARTRDPLLRARALGLVLKKSGGSDLVSAREVLLFLRDALEDDANRGAALEFVRANFDALVAKVPQHSPSRLPEYLAGLCSPRDRDAFVALFQDRAPRFEGGHRRYDEALESIDLCIAARR